MSVVQTITLHPGEIRTLLAAPQGEISRHMNRLGIQVQTAARRNCPVDTGRLRSSIGVTQRFTANGAVTTVGTNVQYAKFVHDGWTTRSGRFIPGRPFLADAIREVFQ